MPPSIFMESVASRHGMFPGGDVSVSPNLNLGLPGMGGPQGAILQMILEPVISSALGPGFLPAQFQPTQNVYDHYRRRMQYQAMQSTVSAAAKSDEEIYASIVRGTAMTAGVQWNDDRERAARMMASDMTRISPILAQMMPDTFDRLHGARGSAQVMAQGIFSGGRYRTDPITGMLGMSADSTSALNRDLYERLYGPGADLTVMKGLGAGRAGQMYDEMSRRGFLPRSLSRDESVRGVATEELSGRGLRGADLEREIGKTVDDLGKLASPQLEEKLRRFESGRVADRIKNMAGAVAAMRDVFGDMGRPDAPMTELIEGLQVITQGGLATMSAGKIEATVRDMANLARRTGMGMDNMTIMMATAAQKADAMGLDRGFGVAAGMQSAAFGISYSNNIGGTPAWGRADKERSIAVDQQLRLNAAASPVANQLAAVVRLGKDIGFKAGSEGEALYRAVTAGETTYTFDGKTKSVHAKSGEWRDLMGRSGIDVGLASAYRSETAYNQKYVSENDLQDLTRRLQFDVDVAPRLNMAYQRGARQAGITDRNTLAKLGAAAAKGLGSGIATDDLQNPDAVAGYLADQLGIDRGDAAKMGQLRQAAEHGWASVEQAVKTNSRLRGYKSADQLITMQRRAMTSGAATEMDETRQESRLQSALAGLGQGSPLSRLMDSLADATPGTEFKDLAAGVLGWVPEGEVGKNLETTIKAMQAEIHTFREVDSGKIRREAEAGAAKVDGHRKRAADLRAQADAAADPATAERLRAAAASEDVAANAAESGLKATADKYTKGDINVLLKSTDLRRVIRDNAISRLKSFQPTVSKQAEEAGLALGATASPADAGRVWQAVRDRRGVFVGESDSLVEKILYDDRSMNVMGPGGFDLLKQVQERNREIRRIAGAEAGGDVGVLLSSDEQRKKARDSKAKVDSLSTRSRELTAQLRAAEDRGDDATANTLRKELEGVNSELGKASDELASVGRESGTTGEALAAAKAIDPRSRARADDLRKAQLTDVGEIQKRLKEGRAAGPGRERSDDEKKRLTAERALRRKADSSVIDDLFKLLGVDAAATDRAAITRDIMRGDRGYEVREAVMSLQKLREIAKTHGADTAEKFQAYLSAGPGATATDEEKALFKSVTAGRGAGGGLTGIDSGHSRRESVTERLRHFAPHQRDDAAGGAGAGGKGGHMDVSIKGDLTIKADGSGRIEAHGRGGTR